jgi:hypothetical protein
MDLQPDEFIQTDPDARLERAFIAEFLQGHGHSMATLHTLPATEVAVLMKQASIYASARLSEVESRAHYVHDIHDAAKRSE